jgi:membrane associated rhomboid family serine protease
MGDAPQVRWGFRKPSKAVLGLMAAMGGLWVMFALAINWGQAGARVYELLVGDSSAVLHGQLWRLVTAPFLHLVQGNGAVSHILFTLLMLYFFLPPLEERWGTRRMFKFLLISALFAYGIETVAFALFPSAANDKWLGGMVLADAACVAWALGARGQTVLLFFVLPVRPMMMVGFMVIWHLMVVIARGSNPEGMFAPFAAMAAGYLFGDGSPLRRLWLKLRLKRLQAEVEALQRKKAPRKPRAAAPHLRVIPGGGKADDDDSMLH